MQPPAYVISELGPLSKKKILSPVVILSMEKTMVDNVISELTSVSRLKISVQTVCHLKFVSGYENLWNWLKDPQLDPIFMLSLPR